MALVSCDLLSVERDAQTVQRAKHKQKTERVLATPAFVERIEYGAYTATYVRSEKVRGSDVMKSGS
jgi:hypothetical protein